VTFVGAAGATGPDVNVRWNFGDGSPEVAGTLTPKHVYDHAGTYTVTLTVTAGSSASDTLTVKVTSAFGCASDARPD
jgi:PKD repeat protein